MSKPIQPVQLKANSIPYAEAHVSTEAGLVKMLVTDNSTRMAMNLELHPDAAIALVQALLAASREANFTRLESLTGKGGAK